MNQRELEHIFQFDEGTGVKYEESPGGAPTSLILHLVPSWHKKGTKLKPLDWPRKQSVDAVQIQKVPGWSEKSTKQLHKKNDHSLNIPLYVEKILEDNLPTVEEAMAELKSAWENSLKAEDDFKKILKGFM
ncbi:hypothetical protein BVY04_01505 [bacterium M21]|nr:hypothetical protein BVY04_01505 [bacterium M21]